MLGAHARDDRTFSETDMLHAWHAASTTVVLPWWIFMEGWAVSLKLFPTCMAQGWFEQACLLQSDDKSRYFVCPNCSANIHQCFKCNLEGSSNPDSPFCADTVHR